MTDPTPQPTSGDDQARWTVTANNRLAWVDSTERIWVWDPGDVHAMYPPAYDALVAIIRDHAAVTQDHERTYERLLVRAAQVDAVTQERDDYHAKFDAVNRALGVVTGQRELVTQERDALRELVDSATVLAFRTRKLQRAGSMLAANKAGELTDLLLAARAALGDTPSDECPGCQGRGWVWEGGNPSIGEGSPADCPVRDDAARAALGDIDG